MLDFAGSLLNFMVLAWIFLFCFHDHFENIHEDHTLWEQILPPSQPFAIPGSHYLSGSRWKAVLSPSFKDPWCTLRHFSWFLLTTTPAKETYSHFFFCIWVTTEWKRVHVCNSHRAVLVKPLLSSSFVQVTKNTLWHSNYCQKISRRTYHQKYNNQLLIWVRILLFTF